MAFEITVNGERRTVDVDGDTPLLWALRDELGIKGPKFGCGIAMCGACTVYVDGYPTRSCSYPIDAIGESEVTTIEAVAETDKSKAFEAVQTAWNEMQVPQCGYCQQGQVMAATALLAENPTPSDDDITNAMDGNVCRCATYHRIRGAIHRASEILEA